MKQFGLVIFKDGRVDQVLAKQPTIADPDDIKEAFNFAVDEYIEDLEDSDADTD